MFANASSRESPCDTHQARAGTSATYSPSGSFSSTLCTACVSIMSPPILIQGSRANQVLSIGIRKLRDRAACNFRPRPDSPANQSVRNQLLIGIQDRIPRHPQPSSQSPRRRQTKSVGKAAHQNRFAQRPIELLLQRTFFVQRNLRKHDLCRDFQNGSLQFYAPA